MKKYKINEIFYSLQGEGYFTGVPAIFIRFSGCNLKCPFCDTNHLTYKEMTAEDVAKEISKYPAYNIVLTGGEPTLFADKDFIDTIKGNHYITIETNGTHEVPQGVDWITLSPKFDVCGDMAKVTIPLCDELKVVYNGQDLSKYDEIQTNLRFLQPMDCGDSEKNKYIIKQTIQACLENPKWRLSLQTHKILDIR